jgi:hypothetical protein
MVLFGFVGCLVLAASVGLAVDVVTENGTSMQILAFGHTYAMSPGSLFVIGCATGVLGLLGFAFMIRGMAAARTRRTVLRESLGATESLKAERDRLAAALDAERIAHGTAEGGAGPAVRVGVPRADALYTAQHPSG